MQVKRDLFVAIVALFAAAGCGGSSNSGGGGGGGGAGGAAVDLCVDVVCAALDACHEVGVCAPATGECSDPPVPNGTRCDDGDACTYGDACDSGVCTSAGDVVCRPLDGCHDIGVCDSATGCVNPVLADGTACGDNDACTKNDRCAAGVCVGDAVVCVAANDCQDAGTCNPGTGTCTQTRKPDGTACDPGGVVDPCEVGQCSAGACVVAPKVCEPIDQCHDIGVCDPTTGNCSDALKIDGAVCEDGDLCTENDACQIGVCISGTTVVCQALDQCHNAGTCTPATGCSNPFKTDGISCDDSDLCTGTDECIAGVCAGNDPVLCAALDACHISGICDPGTGLCSDPPIQDGVPCFDGDLCTIGTTCQGAVCTGGQAVTCIAPECKDVDSCEPGTGCVFVNTTDGNSCEDGDLCTLNDTCTNGVCQPGGAQVCVPLDDCHVVGTCNPATGVCDDPIVTGSPTCDDGSACTVGDVCINGLCVGNAGPDGVVCDDGDACTLADTCAAGNCIGTDPIFCNETCLLGDQTCDPGTGLCVGSAAPNSTTCDDDDRCSGSSSCQAGACAGASPVQCTASSACYNVGFCDPASGMCTAPHDFAGAACSDALCFDELTASAGITWTNPIGSAVEYGGGVGFLDFDGDGLLDIMLAGDGGGIALYRNIDGLTFEDRTVAANLPTDIGMDVAMGVTVADYDNDGDDDLVLVTSRGVRLFDNDGGQFTDVTDTAGLTSNEWANAAAFADFDNDGDLDLYIGYYMSAPGTPPTPITNALHRNNGDGTFTDVTSAYGIGGAGAGTTTAVLWSDFDGDGWLDLFVCNDYGSSLEGNQVFHNEGATATVPADWFVDVSAALGADVTIHCQGLAAGDYDRDLDFDYYVSAIGTNLLWRNDGGSSLTDRATIVGVELDVDACTGDATASWGAGFHDFDCDGYLDLFVVNGYNADPNAPANSVDSPSTVLHHDGAGLTFSEIGLTAGVGDPRQGRGVAFADFDNDGYVDLMAMNASGSPVLYRNTTPRTYGWLQVQLEGRTSNRDGIGARTVATTTAFGLLRQVSAASGFLSASEKRMHFGLGTEMEARITVAWPSGIPQRVLHVPSGTDLLLVEPVVTVQSAAIFSSPVAEGANIQLDVVFENHTGQPVNADYSIEVLVTGEAPFSGPAGTSSVPASGTQPESILILVPAGASGAGTPAVEVIVTVGDTGGGVDQQSDTGQITL